MYRRKEILTLYKTCLCTVKNIGFIPGDFRTNTYIPKNYFLMSLEKRRKSINNLIQKDLGAYVANNIRDEFKKNKYKKDKIEIDKAIDYGYHFLRFNHSYLVPLCKEYLQDLWCYE